MDEWNNAWSNAACIGYVIEAMENAGKTEEEIQSVVSNLVHVFEYMTIEQAKRLYEGSQY